SAALARCATVFETTSFETCCPEFEESRVQVRCQCIGDCSCRKSHLFLSTKPHSPLHNFDASPSGGPNSGSTVHVLTAFGAQDARVEMWSLRTLSLHD